MGSPGQNQGDGSLVALHGDGSAAAHNWEQRKETIRSLYIEKNLTLQRLIQEMKTTHGFDATKAQYERKLTTWGFKKNRKKREWIEIAEKVIARQNDGKFSELVIDNQVIPSKKLKKEVKRYARHLTISTSTQCASTRRSSESDEACCPSFTDSQAVSCSSMIIRSPKLQLVNPQAKPLSPPSVGAFKQNTSISIPSVIHLPRPSSDANTTLFPLLAEASGFLRVQHPVQQADLHACVKQLLTASSPLNDNLKAAMIPAEYSRLMEVDALGQDQSYTTSNLSIMSTALFLFRNSLNEKSFDISHQMFNWFQANYDAQNFKVLAAKKDPLASAILEKLFRQAVWEGDNSMVRELLLNGVDPNQSWRVSDPSCRLRGESKSAIHIACERKHQDIAKLLLNAGACVSPATNPDNDPLCCLLEGDLPLELDVVKMLIVATPKNALPTYSGCLASAIRRQDLNLISVLIEAGVGDNDMLGFSCSQQRCTQTSFEASLRCPRHTISFSVLKHLVVERTFRVLASQRADPSHSQGSMDLIEGWRFLTDLFQSVIHQRDPQAIKFMLDAGACFSKELLLVLCETPDLDVLSELFLEAILSFDKGEGNLDMGSIISNIDKIIALEPFPLPGDAKCQPEADSKRRNPTKNAAKAHKIAKALTELPAGIKLQCCEALVRNPLWRSLGPQDWPYYKEAFEIILQTRELDTDFSHALLLIAVKDRDTVRLHRLLDANPNCSPDALQELLEEVIPWGDVEIFKRMMTELAWTRADDTFLLGKYWRSFMESAILRGDSTTVKELVRAGMGVDFAFVDGLMLAIREQEQELVEFLLQSGANPNEEYLNSALHSTPLAEAISSENKDIVSLLVRFGANPHDPEAIYLAAETDSTMLHAFIRACKKDFLVRGGIATLFDAILNSELDTVQLLLGHGVDCNTLLSLEGSRKTCLAAAIEAHDETVLRLVIDTGVDVNGIVEQHQESARAFPNAYTALVKAIQCQNLNAVDRLLEAGAGVNPTISCSFTFEPTPLQAAAEQGNLALIKKLLDLGANANDDAHPYGGFTALQITATKGLIGVASLLVDHGADVNAKAATKRGKTALEAAAENDRIDMVRFLIDSGADISSGSHQYLEARSLASKHGHFAVCKLLDKLYEEKNGERSFSEGSSTINTSFNPWSDSVIYDVSDEPLDLTLDSGPGEIGSYQSNAGTQAWPSTARSPFTCIPGV